MPSEPPVITATLPDRSGVSAREKCVVPIREAGPPKFSAMAFWDGRRGLVGAGSMGGGR